MAIDFSQVKTITIPEGDVKSISIGGVVVWAAAPAGPVLTSITLAGYNTSLNINSNFLYGGTVTANYSDGSTADVTLATTFSGYNMSTAGTQTVTASYTEGGVTQTATYQLTVVKPASWHTIWSGSLSITSSNFASTAAGTGTTPRIRVTFSGMDASASGGTVSYTVNGTSQSTKPTSPKDITITSTSGSTVLGASAETRYESASARLTRANKTDTNNMSFSFSKSHSDQYNMNQCKASLTVTKIEQYY